MFKKYQELLKDRGLTSYKVSKETGIAYATLSDWKNGKSKPKIDKIRTLSLYFNVPVSYFIEADGDNSEN
ncbi:MAG TPA: XRE family transcriptional regulator [Lachnoclostridium phytofermentans]|uniref:XRE family transcriptional regulator n=1 Tax=Lachnoclostridium phytofermentans TaxID=66219 RepID=A0A3D2X9L4_9FIRM|nr:helix-turn-helix transcriptional regulator [Lachnoclostridium sp.]HCL03812.1 XRE family transcriptional regulator [Lachnoclostridium phytofermentans]